MTEEADGEAQPLGRKGRRFQKQIVEAGVLQFLSDYERHDELLEGMRVNDAISAGWIEDFCRGSNGQIRRGSPHRRYQRFLLKFRSIEFIRRSILEIVVVPNKSFQTTFAGREVGKQSNFAKGIQSLRSGSVGFRRTPENQPVIVRPPQAASGPMPASPSQGNTGQRDAGSTQQKKINKVAVTGRLGRNAVVRQTKNGHVVANFSVAVDESYKDLLGETHKKTAWHRVQVWEELAETVGAGLQKGVRVYVEGRRAFRNWTDRENRKHCYAEIVASDVRFLDPPPARETQNARERNQEYAVA